MRRVLYILGLLSDDDIDWLCSHGERLTVPSGTTLVKQGSDIDAIYIIAEGEFAVVVGRGNKEIARIAGGEVIGEISLVDSLPTTASVVATEDSTVLRLPRQMLHARLQSNPGFGMRFYQALAVFLAHRLRQVLTGFGYATRDDMGERDMDGDELDPDALDRVSLAAERFQWILERLLRTS
jgi:CRP-like cAMP-binding protein